MNIYPAVATVFGEIDFDPDALHRRYLSERDTRVRPDGVGQYQEVQAEFSRFVEDPYVDPDFTRDPVFDDVEFAIIGGDFGGPGTGTAIRAQCATWNPIATCRCWKN